MGFHDAAGPVQFAAYLISSLITAAEGLPR
jgi:hypothetical protein